MTTNNRRNKTGTAERIKEIPTLNIISLVLSIIAILSVFMILFLVSSLFPPNSCRQVNHSSPLLHTISVSATGTASAAPTQAILYILINGTGGTTAIATANLTATLNAFNSSIAPYINYNISHITTSSYSVFKPYPYNNTANIPYRAQEYLNIGIPDISNLSVFLGVISETPNVYVKSAFASFNEIQKSGLRSSAYIKAMDNATAQASAIAKAEGYSDITMINVTTSNGHIFLTTIAGIPFHTDLPYYANKGNLTVSVNAVFKYG